MKVQGVSNQMKPTGWLVTACLEREFLENASMNMHYVAGLRVARRSSKTSKEQQAYFNTWKRTYKRIKVTSYLYLWLFTVQHKV